ncbi:MAG: phospholipid carrier-dependent glycosyltransferase [Planctomycetaceae bacterium]|nr:phospholipid carrier-dependent glycosyltransferase [Planctomycetaceae bacterium]
MKNYRSWFFLFLVALLIRTGAAGYWEYRVGTERFYFGDSDTYWKLGQNIATGKPYSYGNMAIHRMPGYPVLLSPLFLVFGEHPPVRAARFENVVIGSLTVLAVAWLAWILFHDSVLALTAGWITAFEPLNIMMSVLVLSEAPFCLFLVLHLGYWVKAFKSLPKTNWGSLFLSGLFAATAIYCRPSWLYFIPFAVVLGTILSLRNYKPILKSGVVLFAVCTLCLIPWWIRNYYVSGHFVSTTLQVGAGLYDGLNPKATGASDMKFVEEFRNAEIILFPEVTENTLEYQLNRKMRQAAIHWAWKHPDLAWKLAKTKFFRLWNFRPNEPSLSGSAATTIVFCTYCPVLVLGMIGVIRSMFYDFQVWLLWIPAVYITGLHIIFVSSIRYRVPAMICFSILAAWVILDVIKKFRKF